MARRSRRKNRRILTSILALGAISAAATAVTSLRHGHASSGLKEIGIALLALGIALTLTWPTRCRVTTTKGRPCRNEAYGFLLGCPSAGDHHLAKLRIRLGWQESGLARATTDSGELGPTILASESVVMLSIEQSKRDTGGFLLGLVSTVAGVASVVVGVLALH
jgi:hypothetical protein